MASTNGSAEGLVVRGRQHDEPDLGGMDDIGNVVALGMQHHHHHHHPHHLHHVDHQHHGHHHGHDDGHGEEPGKDIDDEEDEGEDVDGDEDEHDQKRRRTIIRKFRDPRRPKKPVTPYLFFMKDVRDRVVATNAHLNFGDVGREVGRLWASLPEETRRLYVARANADKERYQMEMQYYERPREGGRGGRRKKDPKAPKKARSSYAFFMTSVRPLIAQAHPGTKFGEIGRLVGHRWNAMTPEERRPFEDLAEGDKARNALEMDAYLKTRQDMAQSSAQVTARGALAFAAVQASAASAAAAAAAAISQLIIPTVASGSAQGAALPDGPLE